MCWWLSTPNTAAISGSIASRVLTECTISTTDKTLSSADHMECSAVTLSCPPILCFIAVAPVFQGSSYWDWQICSNEKFNRTLVSVLENYSRPLEKGKCWSLLLYSLYWWFTLFLIFLINLISINAIMRQFMPFILIITILFCFFCLFLLPCWLAPVNPGSCMNWITGSPSCMYCPSRTSGEGFRSS